MIITDSNVAMASTRRYAQSGTKGSYSKSESIVSNSFINAYEKYAGLGEQISPSEIQNKLMNTLLQRVLSASAMGSGSNTYNPINMVTYSEYECTTFEASGQARTADGRTIDFNIDVMMSRSYMEYANIQASPMNAILRDPLVINVDSGVTNISNQKFRFDLDADGNEEDIPMLGRGSGFLALDKNEDGIINDGNELFGTKSGDGFGDLRVYDEDGNGWIDEADDIFSKLKVWCKGENGEDILMDLRESGIGAIYLGEQSTEFASYGMGGLNGMIRSTGFFLKENGGVGTVQHVDLAVSDNSNNDTVAINENEASLNEIKSSNNEFKIPEIKIKRRYGKRNRSLEFSRFHEKILREQREEMERQIEKLREERIEHAKKIKGLLAS